MTKQTRAARKKQFIIKQRLANPKSVRFGGIGTKGSRI